MRKRTTLELTGRGDDVTTTQVVDEKLAESRSGPMTCYSARRSNGQRESYCVGGLRQLPV